MIDEEDIRRRAYRIYQEKQRQGIASTPEGNWEEAELEIWVQEHKYETPV